MNTHPPARCFLAGMVLLLSVAATLNAASSPATGDPVTITMEDTTATLGNGVVTVVVNKKNATFRSIQYKGQELLSKGGGYFNFYGGVPAHKDADGKLVAAEKYTQERGEPSTCAITQDPAKNGGEMGELSIRFPASGQPDTVAMDLELRFTLRRGESGFYGWQIANHSARHLPWDMAVNTVCLKLNPDVFDFLSIDSRRQTLMTSPEDWVKGTQLNMWEARLINTGPRKGLVEHKYDYDMLFSETPAWGWSSTKKNVGLFIVNPSIEYLNGPPVMNDYGGHIDVKASLPADPTLLFIWQSPHFGGKMAQINAGESWSKILGPFLFYCNSGPTPKAMYEDALARAAAERKAWPYEWAVAPGYEHKEERGSASGHLTVKDPQDGKATAAGAWVGLASPPYDITLPKGGKLTIDWQTDGKHYGYWIRADSDGRFTVPNARPGTYNLYAFNNGILGDMCHENVVIQAGKTTELGDLTWTPVRYGRQLWDIGIPDRSAGEFRHGDHYWQWGLYGLYPKEFPNDVDYVIGKSDYRTDWNYAQPPRPADAQSAAFNLLPATATAGTDAPGGKGAPAKKNPGKWLPTTWRVHYTVDQPMHGTATLRLVFAAFDGPPVDVTLNGKPIGTTGEVPGSGVMHRDGIRADAVYERDIVFDAALLLKGENVFGLTKGARSWTDGALYDYVRLELDENKKL